MHSFVQLVLCLAVLGNAVANGLSDSNPRDEQPEFELSVELREEWNVFKSKYGKQYKDADEEQRRMKIFAAKMADVKAHNLLYAQGLSSFTRGMGKFSDMTQSEVAKAMTGYKPRVQLDEVHAYKRYAPVGSFKTPDAWDWRLLGYVTPVKDQGDCDSCWAFSVTGALEGQLFRKTKKLVSLSEQQLVDCAVGSKGCEGGNDRGRVTDYIVSNGGIDTNASYPYEEKQGACRFKASTIGTTCKGFLVVVRTEAALKEAVARDGPMSVGIDASHESFEEYTGGVYDEPKCNNSSTNHAVLVVGYGVFKSTGVEFWIVKNSYGTDWGEGGYMRMVRNKNDQCGIASRAIYIQI